MADIQDLDNESDIGELEAVDQQQEPVKSQEPERKLSPFYKDKTNDELIKMHQEAQKLIDRQGVEVSEVRKLADELIKSQLTPNQREVEKPKEVDFFENPQEAIRQQIENHPRVQAAEQFARQAQMEQSKQRLMQMHPDMNQVVQDSAFQDWVKASKVRQQMYQQADAYDLDVANELISTFKELKAVKQQKVAEVDTAARDQTLKAAAVETGGSGESGKKIYRRADLIRLKMREPNKYEAMADEILEAYRSGRVK
jgi:hypothetical protein